jgi:pyruvate ferredoxin oxidoreductase gamma subunit
MYEIRIHGRGGQGAKMAAEILGRAALLEGKFIKAFPEYGPERSGAPVASYVRISSQPIKTYQPVISPQAVLVLDPTLLEVVNVKKGLAEKGILIINSSPDWQLPRKSQQINASEIALKYIGKDKPNTVLLGALAKISRIVKLESLIKIIREIFQSKLDRKEIEANIKALKEGYDNF